MLKNMFRSKIGRNTAWMLLAQGIRLLSQALYFMLLARVLAPAGFGLVTGASALISILAPFAGWGSGHLLVMHTSRNHHDFPQHWGRALVLIATSGVVALLVAAIAAKYAFTGSGAVQVVLGLGAAELLFYSIVETSGQAFQAFERLNRTAQIQTGAAFARLLSVLLFMHYVPVPTPEIWARYYLAGMATYGVCVGLWTSVHLGWPSLNSPIQARVLKDGFHFSLGISAKSVYADIDKTILSHYHALDITGAYGVAYRLINLAFAPIQSLLSASYPLFFQAGAAGLTGVMPLARKLLPVAVVYGLVASAGLSLCAPLIPIVLGSDYGGSVPMIRLLAVIPFIQSIHYIAADMLTGAGLQTFRSYAQVCTAVLNTLLSIWLIPTYSWKGASWATVVSETLLACALWGLITLLRRRRGTRT